MFVVDADPVGDRRRCRGLLRAVIARRTRTGVRTALITEAPVDMAADPELVERMAGAVTPAVTGHRYRTVAA